MIDIKVENLSKKFNNNSIIKGFSHHFESKSHSAIKGGNGVGKSTLIKMLSGYLSPSGGNIVYNFNTTTIKRNDIFKSIALAAPYSSIIKDFTLKENFDLLNQFKSFQVALDYKNLIEILEWQDPKDKLFSQFSSGMQQKVNVCFAMIVNSKILFLDEPTSFMDTNAKNWYKKMYSCYTSERTCIIASNDDFDFSEDAFLINLNKK